MRTCKEMKRKLKALTFPTGLRGILREASHSVDYHGEGILAAVHAVDAQDASESCNLPSARGVHASLQAHYVRAWAMLSPCLGSDIQDCLSLGHPNCVNIKRSRTICSQAKRKNKSLCSIILTNNKMTFKPYLPNFLYPSR